MSTTVSLIRPPHPATAIWGLLWRMGLAFVVGIVLFLFSYAEALDAVDPTGAGSVALGGRLLLDLVLGLVAVGLIPLRRRAPLPVLLLIIALSAGSALAVGAAALIVVSVSTRRRWFGTIATTAVFVTATVLFDLWLPEQEPTAPWLIVVVAVALSCILPIFGMYVGGRRQLLVSLQEQADSARREQQAQREQAQLSERARIAREMHDVLAHRLSLVALHAGVLESRPDLPEAQRVLTVGIVRESAHRALNELRDVLGVLRDPVEASGEQQTHPQPTLLDLPALLEESRLAGTPAVLEVDDTVAGELDALAEATSRHLFRFIQEGLTNARKHAPGQTVSVRIGGEPGGRVTLRLHNSLAGAEFRPPAGPPPSGLGLTGLRERARLAGGHFTAERTEQGRFELGAWLPWMN